MSTYCRFTRFKSMSLNKKIFKSVNNRLTIARKYGAKNTSKIVQDSQDIFHNTNTTVSDKRCKRKNDSDDQLPPKKQKYSDEHTPTSAISNETRPLQPVSNKVSERTGYTHVENNPSVKRCSSKCEKYGLSEKWNNFPKCFGGKHKFMRPQKVTSTSSRESSKSSRQHFDPICTSTSINKLSTKLNTIHSPITKVRRTRDQEKLTPNVSIRTSSTRLENNSFPKKNLEPNGLLSSTSFMQYLDNRTDDTEMNDVMDWSPVNEQHVISDVSIYNITQRYIYI